MTIYVILLTALLPIAILLFYIYRKDKNSPEPVKAIAKAFLLGILSIPLSFCLSVPFGLLGLHTGEATNFMESVRLSFFSAAIPEEVAKFFILWLVLRKNQYFDEKMDGIVYAVCVSLGFAAFENIMYLFTNAENFVTVGILRALFSVPGHFCFGILMGYYYSLAKFYPQESNKNKILILAAPILAHGAYDSILFIIDVTPVLSGVLLIAFCVICFKMWKYASKRIQEHLNRDLAGLSE